MNEPTQPTSYWEAPAERPGPAPGVEFAPHGERLVAYLVDVLTLSVVLTFFEIAAVSTVPFGVRDGGGSVAVGAAASTIFLLAFLVGLAYFPWFWVRGGATPGMRVFKLRVVRDVDGGPVGWGAAILRLVGFWISGLVVYLGFAWILIDSRRRGWHDLLAGTVVVKPG